jgi:L-lactate dehydrogenase complex protein LldE
MGEISAEVADEKARYIQEANPDYLIGADFACLMNIGGRLSRLGSNIKVMHIAEVLNSK